MMMFAIIKIYRERHDADADADRHRRIRLFPISHSHLNRSALCALYANIMRFAAVFAADSSSYSNIPRGFCAM